MEKDFLKLIPMVTVSAYISIQACVITPSGIYLTSLRGYFEEISPKGFLAYLKFGIYIGKNLLIVPALFVGVHHWIKDKDNSWLLHPFALFCNTFIYCLIGLLAFICCGRKN